MFVIKMIFLLDQMVLDYDINGQYYDMAHGLL